MHLYPLIAALVAALCTLLPRPVFAQCEPEWLPGGALPGVNGIVWALTFHPSGDLIIGGEFTLAGDAHVNNIARWDGANWFSLGSGTNGIVRSLAVMPSGDIIAGGRFTLAGGFPVNQIARWDGSQWHALGNGVTQGPTGSLGVYSLQPLPSGELIAGGNFITAGSITANHIARWDGNDWFPLGSGTNGSVVALARLHNGDIVAGGLFSQAGGQPAYIARWDGASWVPLATTYVEAVRALIVTPSGDLIAGGQFVSLGGVFNTKCIARWDGSAWSALGAGFGGPAVRALAILPGGDLIASGDFVSTGANPPLIVNRIARWDGQAWSAMETGMLPYLSNNGVLALAVSPGGELFAGGAFYRAGESFSRNLARWSDNAWRLVGEGTDYVIDRLWTIPRGTGADLLVSGAFSMIEGVPLRGTARFDGQAWSQFSIPGERIWALEVAPDQTLLATGNFGNGDQISQWNGSAWTPLGTGINGFVRAMTHLPSGELVAAGTFTAAGGFVCNRIARRTPAGWRPLGAGVSGPLSSTNIRALAILPGGQLVAGGIFAFAGAVPASNIAMWDGLAWSPLGAGVNAEVRSLAILPNGDLIAAGVFSFAGGAPMLAIARWDGAAWHPLGSGLNGYVDQVVVLPSGDLVAAGGFTLAGGAPAGRIARWDGAQWHFFGAGFDDIVYSIAILPQAWGGGIAAGGFFHRAGEHASAYFARWACPPPPPCYANCDGSTTPPILNIADFACFLAKFAANDPYANCDGSTTPPILNIADFACFLAAFAAGCP